ncbi:DUF488 family protein [Macrococcoides canis]|nr:DUF488 family protein [Macrococcus canis]
MYDKHIPDGKRVLVDRVCPRGISKEDAKLDEWLKDIALSKELRNNEAIHTSSILCLQTVRVLRYMQRIRCLLHRLGLQHNHLVNYAKIKLVVSYYLLMCKLNVL